MHSKDNHKSQQLWCSRMKQFLFQRKQSVNRTARRPLLFRWFYICWRGAKKGLFVSEVACLNQFSRSHLLISYERGAAAAQPFAVINARAVGLRCSSSFEPMFALHKNKHRQHTILFSASDYSHTFVLT